jgi:hypothetical protein
MNILELKRNPDGLTGTKILFFSIIVILVDGPRDLLLDLDI